MVIIGIISIEVRWEQRENGMCGDDSNDWDGGVKI